jgi:hypothetical protein
MIENVERRPLAMTVAKIIRPSHVAGGRLVGAEVEVSASLPRNVEPDRALEAARNGELVLLGNDRLGWARG